MVMEPIELCPTVCAICGTPNNSEEIYPATVNANQFDPEKFSARRLPDQTHYRMVRCRSCGLFRSDPVANPEVVARLYSQSTFSYGDEVSNLRATYGYYLRKLNKYLPQNGSLLEIGCGNGFFLEEAITHGFKDVRGVEPSKDAVAKANPDIRDKIVCDMMRPNLFDPNTFDVVCFFQVLDHLTEPGPILDECMRILQPGGLVLCLNHNIEAISAKLLRDRSPIIDIEHPYLLSPVTISRLFTVHGFKVQEISRAYNKYTLSYIIHLLPLVNGFKQKVLRMLDNNAVGRLRIWLPLGNMYLIAQKPY